MSDDKATENAPRVPLPGSSRNPLPSAANATPVDPTETIHVTVVLRRKAELPSDLVTGQATLTPAELADKYGASAEDIALVRTVVTEAGATVDSVDEGSRRIVLSGAPNTLAALFGTSLVQVVSPDLARGVPVSHRHREGELSVPAALQGVVVAVLGLDDRPQTKPHVRHSHSVSGAVSYTPPQVGHAYKFPTHTTGAGQTLAVIELGGGFAQSELDTYFSKLGITGPTVTSVNVGRGRNKPGQDPNGADGEVLLDIEVAGALAPGADMVVYFAANTDKGFLDAVSLAAQATPTPTAISISWGQSEDGWTGQARAAMDSAFADAAALGVTVTAASGDNGSSDGVPGNDQHVDYPASSPNVLACGGTRLSANAKTGAVHEETVWNDGAGRGATGGGVSDLYQRPAWQSSAGVPATGRGVPDVAGDADPESGYEVLIDGTATVIGGTSAVAPLWAALVCRLAEGAGKKFGLIAPLLYAGATPGGPPPGFRDITEGDNGAFKAGPGWDACTGLGVPDATKLLAHLKA